MTRLLVYGGRDFADREGAFRVLDSLHAVFGFSAVIEGGAKGADRLGRLWGLSRGLPVETFAAEWDNLDVGGCQIRRHRDGRPYNAAAGHQRNARMAERGRPDLAVEFPGGAGTADMRRLLRRAQIEVIEG